MSKLTDQDSVNNNAIGESDSGVATLQTTSQNVEEHGRLAVFIEYPDKANYFCKSKKHK